MFGLKCFDADGNVIFDTESAATRIVWEKSVSAGASSSEVVPIIGTKDIAIVKYTKETDSGGLRVDIGATHKVTRSGTTITWTAKGDATYCPSVDTEIIVLLFD